MRSPRVLVEMALTIALALVLDELRLFQMPQGGTISLGMLPIIVLSFRHGVTTGVITGALFGLVDLMTPPVYIVHWIQPILDYPLAYGAVGLAGLFRTSSSSASSRFSGNLEMLLALIPGVSIAILARYACHVVSGAVFFAEYAPAGQPVVVYSALYNLYVPISGVLCLVAAAVLIPALNRIRPIPVQASRA